MGSHGGDPPDLGSVPSRWETAQRKVRDWCTAITATWQRPRVNGKNIFSKNSKAIEKRPQGNFLLTCSRSNLRKSAILKVSPFTTQPDVSGGSGDIF